jgi:hypothetical protein
MRGGGGLAGCTARWVYFYFILPFALQIVVCSFFNQHCCFSFPCLCRQYLCTLLPDLNLVSGWFSRLSRQSGQAASVLHDVHFFGEMRCEVQVQTAVVFFSWCHSRLGLLNKMQLKKGAAGVAEMVEPLICSS